MPVTRTLSHPLLLPSAARPIRPASLDPRLASGGLGCRVLTTADMLAEIGERTTVIAAQALAAVDCAIAQDIAA